MSASVEASVKSGMKPALQQRSREKADRMLKAGRNLVEQRGYDGMRVNEIATEAGCSVGVFYERFGDKENFFRVLLDSSIADGVAGIETYLAPNRWNGVAADVIISRTVYQIVSWFRNRKGLYCAALTAPSHNDQNLRPFSHSSMKTADALTLLLSTRTAEMTCDNLKASVTFAVQLINGALVLGALTEMSNETEKQVSTDDTILIEDPELATQLSRTICAYLGIAQSSKT